MAILVLAILLSVAGCAPKEEPEKTLTVTMSLGEEEWRIMREYVLPGFEQKFKVKINAYQVEAAQLDKKLEAMSAAGRMEIDVFAQDNMRLATLINKGLVMDLSRYEAKIPEEVFPSLVEAGKFNGKLYFMPYRPNVQIVYFNKDAFKKYDLEVPKNWEELFETAKVFKEKEVRGKVLLKAYGGAATATQLYEFILQAGGDPLSINDEGSIAAFRFLQRLWPYCSPESKRAKWDTTNEILAKDEAYLAQNWPFGVRILVKEYKLEKFGTYHGWRGPAGEAHVVGGEVLGIPKGVQNEELALEFIWYLQSREVQGTLTSKLGWPSIRGDAYYEVEAWQRPHFESVKESLKHGVFRRNVLWWPEYERYINQAFKAIVIDGEPVEATLDEFRKRLEEAKGKY